MRPKPSFGERLFSCAPSFPARLRDPAKLSNGVTGIAVGIEPTVLAEPCAIAITSREGLAEHAHCYRQGLRPKGYPAERSDALRERRRVRRCDKRSASDYRKHPTDGRVEISGSERLEHLPRLPYAGVGWPSSKRAGRALEGCQKYCRGYFCAPDSRSMRRSRRDTVTDDPAQ
jgi:hypothetical protein